MTPKSATPSALGLTTCPVCGHAVRLVGSDEGTQSYKPVHLVTEAPGATPSELRALVNEQAEDEGLWFIARTAPEAYLQQELRHLHAAIEADAHLHNFGCGTNEYGTCPDDLPTEAPGAPLRLADGAVAALDLLLRGNTVTEDETTWQEHAEGIRAAIREGGLSLAIRREMEFEASLGVEDVDSTYGPFPADLARLAAYPDVPASDLDVDRLARALRSMRHFRGMATRIAAEYARLSEPGESKA